MRYFYFIIALLLLPLFASSQNYDIRFNRDSVDCSTRLVCYNVQLRPNGLLNFNLAGQNYRIFYNSGVAAFVSGVSKLPAQYQSFNLVQDVQDVDADVVDGPLTFEATLGFLNYAMDLNDVENGGIFLPANQWTTTSTLCFQVEQAVIDNPGTCLEMVWAREGLTDLYATAFVEISRWVSMNNTTNAMGVHYDDLDSGDGNESCFNDPLPPSAPIVGAITQPTCTIPTGSVVLSGLPTGNWIITRTPGGLTTMGNTTTATISDLPPNGTYTFSVENANTCISGQSTNVVINGIPANPVLGGDNATCRGSSANVTPNIGGMWTSSDISIATVTNTGVVSGLTTGTVTLTFTETATGCSASKSFTVNANPVLGGADAVCVGSSATVTPTTGGTWVSNNNAIATVSNAGVVSGISAGTVTLDFTDSATGCISSKSFTVNANPTAPIVGAITQPICTTPTGSVVLSGLPSGNWTITRAPGGVTTTGNTTSTTISGLPAGATYTFTVVNANNCVSPASANVVIVVVPGAPVLGGDDAVCVGSSATVTPTTGGTWVSNNNAIATVSNAGVVSGISGGTVTLDFTDSATGCTSSKSFTVNANPTAPIVGAITQPTCTTPTGSVVLSGLPSGNWTITRAPGGVTMTGNTTSTTISGLPAGATYTFTVVNANNCISPASVNVLINAIPSNPVLGGADAVCVGSSATVTPTTGGTWVSNNNAIATVSNAGVVSGISAGTVTLDFTDSATGCTSSKSFTVNANPTAPIIGAITQPTCTTPTGSVVLSGLPSGNWTITRSPGGVTTTGNTTSTTINGLPAGATYTFTVVNANNCVSPASANVVIVVVPGAPVLGGDDAVCVGSSATVTPTTGGTWVSNNNAIATVSNQGVVSGISAGTVTLDFTDSATGCTSSKSFTVNANPTAPIVGSITQPTCTTPTGSVVLSGLPSGNWTITRSPGGVTTTGNTTSTTISGIPAGATYTFTVVNANNCISPASANVLINAIPSNLVLGGANEVCVGSSATVTPTTGGTWISNNTAVATVTNTGVVSGISAGTVTLTFTETATGCTSSKSFTVNANPTAPIVGSITQPTCTTPTGSVVLSGLPSGNWTVTRSPGGVTTTGNTTSTTISGLPAGATYTFTVVNANNCVSPASANVVIVVVPGAPVLGGPNAVCVGSSATVTPTTGGTWVSNNNAIATVSNAGVVSGISAGTVTLDFTETATGCTSSRSFTVNANPTAPIVGAITQPTCTTPTGSVVLSGLPSGNWTVTRSPGGVTTTGNTTSTTISGIPAGATYTFTVVNANNCISPASANVLINAIPSNPVLGGANEVCVGSSATVTPTTGGTWLSNNNAIATVSNTGVVSGISAGTVTLTFTETATGCTSSKSFTVNANPTAPIVGAITQPSCTTPTGSVVLSGLPSGNWTVTRAPGGVTTTGNTTSATISGLPAGATYTFTVVNANNCISPASANVVIVVVPGAPVLGGDDAVCVGSSATVTPTTGGTWVSNNNAIATVSNAGVVSGISAGTVTLDFTETATGCTSSRSFTVNANPTAPIVGAITQPTCTTPTGSVVLSGLPSGNWTVTRAPGGVTTTGNTTSATISGLLAGATYTFTVANANNCISPASANVLINAVPSNPVLGGANEVCVGSSATLTPTTGGTWVSNNTAVATVTNTGVVSGISAGTVTLTFIETATGCTSNKSFTVNANPTAPIVGSITQPTCTTPMGSVVLSGLPSGNWTVTRSPGGVTTTGNTTSTTINGLPAGATYTFTVVNANNCVSPASANVLINAVPSNPVLGGVNEVCIGSSATVTPTIGGTWVSSSNAIVTVTNAGLVTGVSGGTATLTFTDASTGCTSSKTVRVVGCFNPDFGVTYVNVPLIGDVSTNDNEIPGNTYSNPPANPSNPAPCTPVISSNGSYTFVCGTIGVYEFYVPVCEPAPNQADCTPVLLKITVLEENDPTAAPIANPDYVSTLQNVDVIIPVKDNDKCQNGPLCTLGIPTIITPPLHGTYNPSTGVYDPNPSFVGLDSLKYSVCDNQTPSKCAETWAYITIEPTGTPNLTNAMDDYAQTPYQTPISGNVKNNDTDPEGNVQTVTPQTVTVPSIGTFVLASTGVFTFTPVSGFYGPTQFPYTTCDNGVPQACATATVHILVEPFGPTFNPDFGVTYVNVPLTGDVSTNDNEIPGSTYSNPPANPSNPAPCTPVISSNGSYTFVCGTIGVYEFYVPVCEPAPNQTDCTPVLLQITVLEENDPTAAPIANPDYVTTLQNVDVIIPVKDNDKCQNGPLCTLGIPTIITPPLHGTYNPNTGLYDPNSSFVGLDSLKYSVCDNQTPSKCAETWAYITIEPTGSPNLTNAMDDYAQTPYQTPVTGNVKTNDFDPEGNIQTVTPQTITVPSIGTFVLASTGVFTFTPLSGFYGPTQFPYTTCDNGVPQACATATVHILVEPFGPTFNPDFGVTYVNVPLTGDVSTNDNEIPGSTYSNPPANPSNPAPCTPLISSNGSYTFVCGTIGVYEFYVPVCEPAPNQTDCIPVLLQITVLEENDPTAAPIANPDYVTTLQNVDVIIPVKDNDKCQNGPLCTLGIPTIITPPLHGTYNPNTGLYDPNSSFVGLDSLKYSVCDNQTPSKCAETWAYITIEPTGSPNLTNAMDDYAQTPYQTPVTGDVKTNDTDPEGNVQTVTPQTTTIAGKGTLVLASTGLFTFTPDDGFYGPIQFPYTTCDNGVPQACATATLHILVQPQLCITPTLKVLLEGPYVDNGSNGSTMTTKLNDLGYLPGQRPSTFFGIPTPAGQPYSGAPWNYNGQEGTFYNHTPEVPATDKANYPSTITDWVLVSLRESMNTSSTICTKAALLHSDGTVQMVSGFDCCDLDLAKTYYVVVEHRNHLIVVSHEKVAIINNGISYDFTAQQSYKGVLGFGQALINGKYVMYAGNGEQSISVNADTDINVNDKDAWLFQIGLNSSYYNNDLELNGDVNVQDKNVWVKNNGKFSDVPR